MDPFETNPFGILTFIVAPAMRCDGYQKKEQTEGVVER
jgi:hypothetical protein